MRKREKAEKGMKRAFIMGTLLLAATVGLPALVRELDLKRDDGARSPDGLDLTYEHHHVTSADGTIIHLTVTGEGEQTVFLVHGWTCNESVFRFLRPVLAERYRVVTMELRGHGDSSLPKNLDYRTGTMAEDLKAAIDYIDPTEFAVAAFSMGGFVTLKFCERFGEEYYSRLKGIVLMDSSGVDPLDSQRGGTMMKRFYPFPISNILYLMGRPSKVSDAIKDLFGKTPGAYYLVRSVVFGDKPCGSYVEAQREMTFSTSLSTIVLSMKSIYDHHVDHLPDISIPVLLLNGQKDKLVSVSAARRTAETLPNARLKVFPGAGHDCLLERWEDFNEDIAAFLDEVLA